jgi:hypothetical protein
MRNVIPLHSLLFHHIYRSEKRGETAVAIPARFLRALLNDVKSEDLSGTL